MPTITINTTTQASGISYDWDRAYDIKTVADAQAEYLRLRDQLLSIPKTLAAMEALAAADGFTLPTEDFAALVEQVAAAVLEANPGKIIRLLPAPDSYGQLSYGLALIMPNQLLSDAEEVEKSELAPEVLVDEDGRPWAEGTLQALAEAHQLLVSGNYQLTTMAELLESLPG